MAEHKDDLGLIRLLFPSLVYSFSDLAGAFCLFVSSARNATENTHDDTETWTVGHWAPQPPYQRIQVVTISLSEVTQFLTGEQTSLKLANSYGVAGTFMRPHPLIPGSASSIPKYLSLTGTKATLSDRPTSTFDAPKCIRPSKHLRAVSSIVTQVASNTSLPMYLLSS